ncbi:MAG: efflux RND transporter periplasmic adaptor subunit [Aquabacterium sp.]
MPAEPVVHLGMPDVLACVRATLDTDGWGPGSTALVSQVGRFLGASRVSLGWITRDTLKVVALSDGVVMEEGVAIPELHQAMLEASHQHTTLVWPPTRAMNERITLAHQALSKTQGLSGLVSVPLARHGQALGVLVCERAVQADPLRPNTSDASGAFLPEQVQWIESLAEVAAPMLMLRYQADRPWLDRRRAQWYEFRLRLADPAERGLRWGLGGLAAVLVVGALVPMPHQVTANARLEGAVQRVMSAPQDGFLREVMVRPGDVVKAGQVLAQLSDDDLQGARRARLAEVAQHENEFSEAFARGDRAQAMTAQNKLAESKAELSLIDQQLTRLRVVAPFDGVVIQGDLRQQLGAPLKRGENLLTLAPGLDWRVVLEVDESDIASLERGQVAGLRLAALPDQAIGLLLERVTPVAKNTPNGVKYEIEARPNGAGAGATGLRPGLQGVARIEMPARPLLWRAAVRSWQWLRMLAWTWL